VAARAVGLIAITAEMLALVDAAQPCRGRRSRYRAGMPIERLTYDDAVWVEEYAPQAVALFRAAHRVPLWTMAGSSSGYGGDRSGYSGSGYGGSGYGGDGYGSGYSGSGYDGIGYGGSGYGGIGYGDDGSGAGGSGYGYADGSGDGSGYGYTVAPS